MLHNARLLKLGFLADFMSQTALVGFLTGVGFQVAIAVLGQMLGLDTASRRSVVQLVQVLRQLSHVNTLAVAISVSVVVLIFGLRWISPRLPGSLVAVAGAIVASMI